MAEKQYTFAGELIPVSEHPSDLVYCEDTREYHERGDCYGLEGMDRNGKQVSEYWYSLRAYNDREEELEEERQEYIDGLLGEFFQQCVEWIDEYAVSDDSISAYTGCIDSGYATDQVQEAIGDELGELEETLGLKLSDDWVDLKQLAERVTDEILSSDSMLTDVDNEYSTGPSYTLDSICIGDQEDQIELHRIQEFLEEKGLELSLEETVTLLEDYGERQRDFSLSDCNRLRKVVWDVNNGEYIRTFPTSWEGNRWCEYWKENQKAYPRTTRQIRDYPSVTLTSYVGQRISYYVTTETIADAIADLFDRDRPDETETESKIRRRIMSGDIEEYRSIPVTMKHSQQAGNCRQGTRDWLERHGILTESIPVGQVLGVTKRPEAIKACVKAIVSYQRGI